MAPNARSVLSALKRMGELEITTVATGHGPLLHHNVNELTGRYRTGAKRKRAKRLSPCFMSQITGIAIAFLNCQWHYQNRRQRRND